MLPFSKRPPPPEEYLLRSGDFEAVNNGSRPRSFAPNSNSAPPPNSYANPSIPPAPRAPIFARQAASTPYGFSQRSQNQGYSQNVDQSLAPPHSLAPVAMSAQSMDRGQNHLAATGTNRAMSMSQSGSNAVLRDKPSLKWGVMIALTGALLGGVLGLGMDARRQSARAAAAQEARDNAPSSPLAVAAPVLPAAVPVVQTPVANQIVAPVAVASVAPGAAPAVAVPAGAVVIPPSVGVVVTPAKGDAAVAKAKQAKPIFRFSAKVNRPAAEPKEAPEPKVAKADPPAAPEPKAKPAPAKGGASTSEAQKILEAANKDTVNTL